MTPRAPTTFVILSFAASLAAGCLVPPPADPSDVDPAELWPGAFAVYLEGATLLLPVVSPDAGGAQAEAPGLWLLDDEGIVRAEVRPARGLAESMGCDDEELPEDLERCDAAVLDGGRPAVVVTRFDDGGAPVAGPALSGWLAECGCFEPEHEELEVIEPETAASAPETDEAAAEPEPCAPRYRDRGAVSLLGGSLYLLALEDRSACDEGVSFAVEALPLVPGQAPPDGPAAEVCVAGLPFDDWQTLDRPCPRRRSRRPECAPCSDPAPDTWVPMGWSGQLVEIGPEALEQGGAVAVVRSAELSAETCLSEADPCGPAEGFVDLEAHDAYWVSADGVFALVLDDGELSVWLAGSTEPIWGGVEASGDVIGVRYHGSPAPLFEAMERATAAAR